MRNILSFFTLVLCVVYVNASSIEKGYKKLIEKYDVDDSAKHVNKNCPTDFWLAVYYNNESLIKFCNDMAKNRGAEKEALKKIKDIPRFYPQYDESIIESMQGFCDTVLIDMGIDKLPLSCTLHLVNSDDVNAFTVLTEDGFAMCLTTALLCKKGVNYNIIMGYVAHEFVHGAFQHHLRSLYANAKERRKNELLAGIAAGLNGIAAGANAYAAGSAGVVYDNSPYYDAIKRLDNEVKISTLKYTYAYSREQEYEADLVAFRFLENLGLGEEFINGLRILGSMYDYLYDEFTDHPTTTSRIEFLKFVRENPSIGNKVNKKMRNKRLAPNPWNPMRR